MVTRCAYFGERKVRSSVVCSIKYVCFRHMFFYFGPENMTLTLEMATSLLIDTAGSCSCFALNSGLTIRADLEQCAREDLRGELPNKPPQVGSVCSSSCNFLMKGARAKRAVDGAAPHISERFPGAGHRLILFVGGVSSSRCLSPAASDRCLTALAPGCGRRTDHHFGFAAACNRRSPRRSLLERSNHWDASGAARICISQVRTADGMASIAVGRCIVIRLKEVRLSRGVYHLLPPTCKLK